MVKFFKDILHMKLKFLAVFFIVFCVISFKTVAYGGSNQTPPSPSVFVPESRYTFQPVLDGTEVTHDFVIQNKGNGPLEIEKVRTG